MRIGALVRFTRGYGSDTFQVVANLGKFVALRALRNGATYASGETIIAELADLQALR